MTGGAAVTCPMLGVALVPDNAAVRRFVEVAARFGPAWPLAPRLGPSHNLPHVSLMHGRFRDPATARARVEAWVTGLRPPPPLRTAGVEYVPCGWYFLRVARDPWLLAAHDALFAAVADALVVTDADRGKDTTGHS
ncbi:MAG TPA: hypothetical protein VK324_05915, partial [Tepidisphaeraceae bacterium]|nr:hypothetical protein [Tepidisphaeraceae bacterium]